VEPRQVRVDCGGSDVGGRFRILALETGRLRLADQGRRETRGDHAIGGPSAEQRGFWKCNERRANSGGDELGCRHEWGGDAIRHDGIGGATSDSFAERCTAEQFAADCASAGRSQRFKARGFRDATGEC